MENTGPTRTSDSSARTSPKEAQKIRILLADDHAAVREAMASLFEYKKDFEVVGQAADGAEAVRLTAQTRPDIVLMDVSMPRMNGVEATALIRIKSPETRVIGLSMHEDDSVRDLMLSAGASAYHCKTAPLEKLFDTIRKLLGQS